VGANYRKIQASSDSTALANAPKALNTENLMPLLALGRKQLPQDAPPDFSKFGQHMPQLETTHFLRTEADVLRATGLYLLHPVNVVAASLVHNGRLTCTSETATTKGGRTDIIWMHQADNANELKPIAILELKNTKVLHLSDFQPAYCPTQTKELDRNKIETAFEKTSKTHLIGNAVWLSKQAIKYSKECSTKHVAIFDWDAMFIFDFSAMNEGADHPKFARGTIFEERTSQPGVTFRLLLLGFLVRAMKSHDII
jgi:hypothetical protein